MYMPEDNYQPIFLKAKPVIHVTSFYQIMNLPEGLSFTCHIVEDRKVVGQDKPGAIEINI